MRLTKKIVKDAMSNLAITQVELASTLKVSPRQVNRWFAAKGRIPVKYHPEIKKILNLTDDENTPHINERDFPDLFLRSSMGDLKRIGATISMKSANEYEFINQKFGISKQKLIELAPLLLNCLASLALNHDHDELRKYEELDLPDGWGPSEPEAQKKVEDQKRSVEEMDAFKYGSLTKFINQILEANLDCGTEATWEAECEVWEKFIESKNLNVGKEHEKLVLKTMFTLFSFDATEMDQLLYPVSAFPTSFKNFYKDMPIGQQNKLFIGLFLNGRLDLSKIAPELWKTGPPEQLKLEIDKLVEDTIRRKKENGISEDELIDLELAFKYPGISLGGATVEYNDDMSVKNIKYENPGQNK